MVSLDEIYGIGLDEYCRIQGTTPDQLIQKTKTDMVLLKMRLHHLVWHEVQNSHTDELIRVVKEKLERKRKHLERLKKWNKN
ncbi:hypothetical protein NrS5_06 [Nitratiruptor phage NrS-5]|uniref:hypothetical protein n=1 Tax=unclassified Nitratiruptor TaxID=2624044 RepID=UPI00191627CD|nr:MULTISPECIES: hypothetical protein [unclassified Nitratiruptor]BCD61710.1 hypothetical protein NitYY0813_C0570 [Nitratiruptor sp. YY08-13]BCD65645.1 hypothetical protein NitYY0826_C0572 [Nitratiruptor sp. YY08-26]BCD83188.1 hypothetical protein NrS4_06 [Nitratiruptor phage NrS-4]BCD83247.1 hypothetical protein NrS5_06 [Nitratiruptor phage NrS-5]